MRPFVDNCLKFAMALLMLSFVLMAGPVRPSSSQTVQADLTVSCPFNLTLNSLPIYSRDGNFILNYTAYTLAPCSLSDTQGSFQLQYQSNGTVFVSQLLSLSSITQTKLTYDLPP